MEISKMMKKTILASTLMALLATGAASANDETQELRKIIAEQQKVLDALEKRLNENEVRIEATADQVESSTSASPFANTTIGGYGELHYNNIDNNQGSDKKEIDFHRFVLFFGHEFSDKLRFFSEFELEHSLAGEGKDGEVELEQAYIEYDYSESITTKTGLFLVPVGLINETHEPPTFYGVERNPVEKNIIPATWWEAGAAFTYKPTGGLSFDAAITSGLEVGSDYKIRGGRQKVSEANANDLAFTGRVKYTAIPGLELAATVQVQQDITQGAAGVDTADATLIEAHAVYSQKSFTLKALYATWDINGAEAEALGRDEQTGWYVEPSYKINDEFGVFARYSAYDNNAGDSADTEEKLTAVGVNYYLHPQVVLKADYEDYSGKSDKSGFNLGVGYQF
jgi:phosphate-selective porin